MVPAVPDLSTIIVRLPTDMKLDCVVSFDDSGNCVLWPGLPLSIGPDRSR